MGHSALQSFPQRDRVHVYTLSTMRALPVTSFDASCRIHLLRCVLKLTSIHPNRQHTNNTASSPWAWTPAPAAINTWTRRLAKSSSFRPGAPSFRTFASQFLPSLYHIDLLWTMLPTLPISGYRAARPTLIEHQKSLTYTSQIQWRLYFCSKWLCWWKNTSVCFSNLGN